MDFGGSANHEILPSRTSMIKRQMSSVLARFLEESLLSLLVLCRNRSFFRAGYYRFLTTILAGSAPRLFVDPFECIGAAIVANSDYYESSDINSLKLYLSNLPPTKVLYVDVGANIGNHIISLSGYFSKAIGFEPVEFNFYACKANVSYNGLNDYVKIFRCALGDGAGRASMTLPAQSPHLSGDQRNNGMYSCTSESTCFLPDENRRGERKRHQQFSVPVRRGDSVLREYAQGYSRIIIKLDCEGKEASVLLGLRGIFEIASVAHADFIILAEFLTLETFEVMKEVLIDFQDCYGYSCQFMVSQNGFYHPADSSIVRKAIPLGMLLIRLSLD